MKILGVTVSEFNLANTCWEMANLAENKIQKMFREDSKSLVIYS
jgi:hypothetical protein